MAKVNVPAPPTPAVVKYDQFKGVDFSKDAYLVDKNRSPDAVNVISDKGGQPEKRIGWKTLHSLAGSVNGLARGYIGQDQVLLAHVGTRLYRWDGATPVLLREGVHDAKSVIFFAQKAGKTAAYFLTGTEYLIYDGAVVKAVAEDATVPVTLIAKKPNGGGVVLNPVNLLQSKRIEKFAGNATDKLYQLATKELDADAVIVKLEDDTGTQAEQKEGVDFSVNRQTGQITFITAPPKAAVEGRDNVFITYNKTVEGYADRILKCTKMTHYGVSASDRIFVTRNPDHRARDWWSEMNDPSYFPDLNYAVVGNNNTEIMGYSKLGRYLIITKADNQQDTSIFSRVGQLVNGRAAFLTEQGVTGAGAIAPDTFVSLVDEPLFLARTGVYAITSNVVTAERTLQNRSGFVDARLLREPGLEKAAACEWNGYYLLAVNGHVYLLDARQKSFSRENTAYVYEAYYWENIPAVCFLSVDGLLYFGTADGRICRMKTDDPTMGRFSDDGAAIKAVWSTKMDDDGLPHMLKTMQKKGCLVTLKPLTRSGVQLAVKTEKDTVSRTIKQAAAGIFDWEEIDFRDFTFISNDNARAVVIKKKIKKYRTLQFFAKNDRVDQGFGLFEIVKSWVPVNYVKR